MKLSVIIPAYNEEKRIRKTISRLSAYLKKHFPENEIIIVDDGSTDRTYAILKELQANRPDLKLFHYEPNQGKGFAVKQGVYQSSGGIVVFTDADLSTPVFEIKRFVTLMKEKNVPVLIGSRSIPGASIKIRQPFYRESMGKVFNCFVRLLTPIRFRDTQCGFKMFRRDAAEKIFAETRQSGFTFDVEVLLLARKFGFQTMEIPVTWINNRRSKVNPVSDSWAMFRDLWRLRKSWQGT